MDEQQEKQFITGFNNGYLLAKFLPELLIRLVKNLTPTNEYFQGFFSGSKEFEMENSKRQLDDLRRIRTQTKRLGRDFEKEI